MGERGLLLWSWNQREGVEPKKVWLEREGCLQHIGSARPPCPMSVMYGMWCVGVHCGHVSVPSWRRTGLSAWGLLAARVRYE